MSVKCVCPSLSHGGFGLTQTRLAAISLCVRACVSVMKGRRAGSEDPSEGLVIRASLS